MMKMFVPWELFDEVMERFIVIIYFLPLMINRPYCSFSTDQIIKFSKN